MDGVWQNLMPTFEVPRYYLEDSGDQLQNFNAGLLRNLIQVYSYQRFPRVLKY